MQIADVLDALADAAVNVETLIVDGGMTENTSLMQSLADAIGIPVQVADAPDASALGAANLAGLGIGALSIEDLDRRTSSYRSIRPTKSREQQQARREAWKIAVRQARENGYDRSGQ
jgi:glycerol kinase